MKHSTLHTIGLYIFAVALILMVIVTSTCESDMPFKFIILLFIADLIIFATGWILTILFREEEEKWRK